MEAMKRVKAYSAADKIQAEMLVEMLNRNQIQAYRQGKGSGGYMDIYAGFSIYGEDIFVDEADLPRADQLIQEMLLELPDEDTEKDPAGEMKAKQTNRYSKGQMMVSAIVAVILCAGIIFSVIYSLF